MKVLQLISSGGMYGAEAVVLNLTQCLARMGHQSLLGVFANSAGGDVQLHHEALARDLNSRLLPCSGQFDFRVLAQLRQLVREENIDLVHAHGYKADFYTYFALRRAGIPLVATCHTWKNTDLKVTAYGALDRLILRRFDAVVAVSKELETTLLKAGFRPKRLHVIHNGVDLAPFRQASGGTSVADSSDRNFRIGLIGRLSPEKGVDLFLQAAALVLAQHPSVEFVIAGDGPEREALKGLAGQLGILQAVHFLGRCDAMPELLASLDLVVSASRGEGLPMTILESMASARPIVATDVGEVATVLDGGRAGILVPPEDPHALTAAILYMLENESVRRRYADHAQSHVATHFSAQQMASQYLSLYTEVMAIAGATVR